MDRQLVRCPHPPASQVPAPFTGLGEWLELLVQPAVILGGGALFLNLLNEQRIDDLRSDLGKLDAKLDRLIERRLPTHPQ